MTETLHRPLRQPAAASTPPRQPLQAGLMAASWSVAAGLIATALPVLVVWMADARSGADAAEALRAAGQVWLVAHGVDLAVPGGSFGLAPLGLVLLPALLLLRAGSHSSRECRVARLPDALRLAVAVAVPYGVLTAVVAGLSRSGSVTPQSWQALAYGFLVGGLGALVGIVRAARLWPAVLPALPARFSRLVVAAGVALLVILGSAALLAGASLARHLSQAQDLARSSSPGVIGGFALLLLGLALIPNAVIWAAAWIVGPGFAIGAGTTVGPFAHEVGAVPAVPLLAALPGAVPGWVGLLVVALPVAAGALAGVLVHRRLPPMGPWRSAGEAALVGPLAGFVAALGCWVSGGPLGGERLTAVGPSPWQVGLVLAVEVGLGAAAVAALTTLRRTGWAATPWRRRVRP